MSRRNAGIAVVLFVASFLWFGSAFSETVILKDDTGLATFLLKDNGLDVHGRKTYSYVFSMDKPSCKLKTSGRMVFYKAEDEEEYLLDGETVKTSLFIDKESEIADSAIIDVDVESKRPRYINYMLENPRSDKIGCKWINHGSVAFYAK
jgi:hypothetical protein